MFRTQTIKKTIFTRRGASVEERPMTKAEEAAFDKSFSHLDKAFAEMDRAFSAMGRVFK